MANRSSQLSKRRIVMGISLAPEEKDALQRAAYADDRPVSVFARRVLVDHLRQAGFLPALKETIDTKGS